MTIKRGDTRPVVYRVNADLTGATLRFLLRPAVGAPTLIDVPGAVAVTEPGGASSLVTVPVDAFADELSPPGGWFVELEATVGVFVQTFPNLGYGRLKVIPDLG